MLKNIKHEKFARAVVTNPSFTKAYQEVYQVENNKIAGDSASRLLENVGIKERIVQIMNENSLSVNHLTKRLNHWVNEDIPNASVKCIELGYKLHGLLGNDDDTAKQAQQLNVNVQIIGKSDNAS